MSPRERKRELKQQEIANLKNRLRKLRVNWGRGLKSWIEKPINNARLNSFTTYEAGIPRFTALIKDCKGDFQRFWSAVEKVDP